MKKTYVNAMLQVVSIKKNDIITGSNPKLSGTYTGGDPILGADRFRDFEEDYSY